MQKDFIMFFDKLEEDTTLRKRFVNSKSIEEAFEVALPYLSKCSFKEFNECLLIVASKISSGPNKLDDSELESIVGGMGFSEVLDYFGNSKRVSALACATVLSFGDISVNASDMQPVDPIVEGQLNSSEDKIR